MRRPVLAAIAVLALAGSAQAAGPNLVTNGSFEQNNLTPTQLAALALHAGHAAPFVGVEIDTHYNFAGAVTGWTSPAAANNSDYNLYFFDGGTAQSGDADSRYGGEQQRPNINFTGDSPDGDAFMILDGDPGFSGRFEQTINGLTVGKQYELSFWWAGGELSNRTGYSTSTLTGNFGTSGFTTPTFTNLAGPNAPGDFSGWRFFQQTFTAQTATQVISFLSVGTAPTSNLPPVAFLDGVSLTSVPEPGVWALMLLGFGGLGAAMRRRRRLAAA